MRFTKDKFKNLKCIFNIQNLRKIFNRLLEVTEF